MKLNKTKIGSFIVKSIKWFFLISICSVLIFRFIPVPVTPLMLIRLTDQIGAGKPMKLRKDWVSKDNISNYLQLAVVCTEDQNFLTHHGFDIKAIEKAIEHNKRSKRKRGASTISQQTAKNLFLWEGRSWVRKGLEVYFTFLIETFWSKERIMEVYLNIIEMGDGVYGAEAASQEYFNKSAKQISMGEAATIACLLPSPIRYSKIRKSGYIQGRKAWTVRQMGYWGGKLVYP